MQLSTTKKARKDAGAHRLSYLVAPIATLLVAIFVSAAGAEEIPSTFHLVDARERGAFDIGSAVAGASSVFDEETSSRVMKLDYGISPRSHAGLWTKSYPWPLKRAYKTGLVDAVKLAVRVPEAEQLRQVTVKVEIKGKKSWTTVPLRLKSGWNYHREPINWTSLGELDEVVFVVSSIATEGEVEGLLYFDVEFFPLTFLQKYLAFAKVGSVLALGLILAFLVSLLGRRVRPEGFRPLAARLPRDLLYGIAAVLIIGVAISINAMGKGNPLDVGFALNFLGVGLLGALIAHLLKSGLTGKNLTAAETFQNVLVTGLLAATVSRLEILHAPSSWAEMLMINKVLAILVFLIYHISNAGLLAKYGRHLRAIPASLIVGVPFLLNWLMVTEDAALMGASLNAISGGLLAAQPVMLQTLGRLLVVFVFNEIVTNAIGLATKGSLLKTFKAHGMILLVSLGVVVAPLIADLGSTPAVAALPGLVGALVVILTTMLAFGGLWGEVYLITGVALDGGHHTAPSNQTIAEHVSTGVKKGMAYSAIVMALLFSLHMFLNASVAQQMMGSLPVALGILAGALLFPLLKTIAETFDGSLPFFSRVRYSYRDWTLFARGAVVGFGFGYGLSHAFIQQSMPERILFGLLVGVMASAGISILRDAVYASRGQGHVQSWRMYFIDAFLGAFVGSAIAFYLDALQVPVIVEKFKLYTSAGFASKEYITYPLVNKWGRIDLGSYSGGAKLIFTESLAGVINWSIAAWLFAINKVFLLALFEKHKAPIKFFFSKEGFGQLIEHMIYVLRWGLWMSPIIFTFLRMMPDPTWYNQDGAIRTLVAIGSNATMSTAGFREWSLSVFVYIMAFDFFRVLIWMDHMGLRVATLVNLSFIGMDRLDEKIAKFIGPATAQRYIPEAVKRFTTWGPLLIPFFLPRGAEWDYVWGTSEALQSAANAKAGGLLGSVQALGMPVQILLLVLAVLICSAISFTLRSIRRRGAQRRLKSYTLSNTDYRVVVRESGEIYSDVDHRKRGVFPEEYDVTRRAYDGIDPCGRILFLLDESEQPGSSKRFWPVIGNFPQDRFRASRVEQTENSLKVTNASNGIKTTVDITLPDKDANAEIWNITVENHTDKARRIKVVPYMEWVLNGGLHDRFHTQYARLFPEMEYAREVNAVLAWQKSTKSMGILASETPPEGMHTSRMDFIGRAQSIWKPRIFDTMAFLGVQDMAPYPTFDPIGSMVVDAGVEAKSSKTVRLMVGYATSRDAGLKLIRTYLKPQAGDQAPAQKKDGRILIGHGEILPGTPQPYSDFTDEGKKLLVHTPFTPRPYDHAMSNAMHSVMVTNRGLHTSCNGNSQQNRLTPDWPDTVTKEIPTEAFYLYDEGRKEWYSPTYHPLNDRNAEYTSEFGVDGTAVLRMKRESLTSELTVFVPPEDPLGVYVLKVRNESDQVRRLRVAPYFQMVLEFQPEKSGTLRKRFDSKTNALFFDNPRNMFRTGWAFAAMTAKAQSTETNRGKFFGTGRGVDRPYLAEKGFSDNTHETDDRQIAGFLTTLEVPAHGESTLAVVLGQADDWKEANRLVREYNTVEAVAEKLRDTQRWWLSLMQTVTIETNNPAFDHLQSWLKYQALAERIWARRGFYQTSGAFGFRDQLQDTVNLMMVDPALARKQILLHASHQFPEGDVYHWFFTRTDGRTAFACRSHASDNPVWLTWAVMEYVKATGDETLLDERTSYVASEFPFAGLPKNKTGWGHLYHRSTREDSVYKHCMCVIDLVLKKRTGKNGLPLIQTGDWNDGLDEIGSEGKGESVWLGFFLYYILKDMLGIIEKKDGATARAYYEKRLGALGDALEKTWRDDRYLRAFHDDGTEIGIKDSGIWETDALTASWAVMADINFERGLTAFNTALRVLEKGNTILLGWPPLRPDSKPYLGRSSKYPEGVRENGMYCHGVQWMVRGARILAEKFEAQGNQAKAQEYRQAAYRLWLKVSAIPHVTPEEIELYGGQPNKQGADILTTFDRGRMIWHGYTGAAGWMVRQALEGVVGASMVNNKFILPNDLDKPRGDLRIHRVTRDVGKSPLRRNGSSGLQQPQTPREDEALV